MGSADISAWPGSGKGHHESPFEGSQLAAMLDLLLYAGKLYTTMGNYGCKFTCGISLCRRAAPILRGCQKRCHVLVSLGRAITNSIREVHHLQGEKYDVQHSLVFQNIYHIGDTKSAQELEVFLRMHRKQLCENTKPKTSFVEPQGTTTPNHFSSKPFARHTNTNQPRRMAVFQSLSICYF